MTTKTGGTLATTTLTGVQFNYAPATLSDADLATISQGIYDDQLLAGAFVKSNTPNNPFVRNGQLFVPNRGVLKVLVGDWVFIDPATGWPILISGNALPTTLTATGNTHTSTLLDNLSVNVKTLGWKPGMPITGTDVPASTQIAAIAANGLSLTLSAAATGTHSGNTYTVSNFTHS
jgi:hypothetical protein